MIFQKLLGSAKVGGGTRPTVTLDNTAFDTSTSATFNFNYAASYSVGAFVVVVVTARLASGAGTWNSVIDSAGNTFNLAVRGTQSNNLTFSAVYFCVLTNAVTSATTITATASGLVTNNGRHGAVFILTNIADVENTANTPTSSLPVTASTTTVSGVGVAFHVVSTGLRSTFVTSVSSKFTLQVESRNQFCSQYIATSVIDELANASVTDVMTFSVASGNFANMMAIFE